jgi:hypothetical protein
MTQTTCAARAAVPTGQFNWQLFSVTIEIDLAGHAWCSVCRFSSDGAVTTAGIARSCSDPLNQVPAKNQAYVPNKLRLTAHLSPRICSYRWWMRKYCACRSMSQDCPGGQSHPDRDESGLDNVCALIGVKRGSRPMDRELASSKLDSSAH